MIYRCQVNKSKSIYKDQSKCNTQQAEQPIFYKSHNFSYGKQVIVLSASNVSFTFIKQIFLSVKDWKEYR